MQLTSETFSLRLKHPFNVAYARTPSGTTHERTIVYVHMEAEGITGTGEASPSKRYGETAETVQHFVATLAGKPLPVPFYKDAFLWGVDQHATGNTAAKCAIDMAWHDWWCKLNGMSLGKYLSLRHLPRVGATVSSFTIGIDEIAVISQKVREAEEYPILKVKLGTDNDEAIIAAVRDATDKPVRIDANEGWGTKEEALRKIEWLSKLSVELIEQPLPASMGADMPWLKERSPLPIYADESCGRRSQLADLRDKFHGINLKLMKSTGLGEAIRMIDDAREMEMKIMIGCFIESSLAVTAAAQLAPYCDVADLDGAALCENDPYVGATMAEGNLVLPTGIGIGAAKRK